MHDTTAGRRIVPSAVPAELAELRSDPPFSALDERTEALLEHTLRKHGDVTLTNPYFWSDALADDKNIRNELPDILARCMANIDRACRGEQIARDAITTALSQLQSLARPEAEEYPE